MRIGDARVYCLDPVYGQRFAGWLALELVGAVRRSYRDRQRVALRIVDKACRFIGVRKKLVPGAIL
jgi:hypothetical protein